MHECKNSLMLLIKYTYCMTKLDLYITIVYVRALQALQV